MTLSFRVRQERICLVLKRLQQFVSRLGYEAGGTLWHNRGRFDRPSWRERMPACRNHLEVYRERPLSACWKVPAFCNNDWIALSLAQMCEDLGFERPFDIVYGSPQCAWAGGRASVIRQPLTERELCMRFEAYARYGIRCALTLSRLTVDPDTYADPYANLLLSVAERYNGEVIVADDGLASYVRARHPALELVASFDRALSDAAPGMPDHLRETSYYEEALALFDKVVVRCEYALDDCGISQMARKDRARIEVIVAEGWPV